MLWNCRPEIHTALLAPADEFWVATGCENWDKNRNDGRGMVSILSVSPRGNWNQQCLSETTAKMVKEGGGGSSRERFCFLCHSENKWKRGQHAGGKKYHNTTFYFFLGSFAHLRPFCCFWHWMLMQGRDRKTRENCVGIDGTVTSSTTCTPEWCVAKANLPVQYTCSVCMDLLSYWSIHLV